MEEVVLIIGAGQSGLAVAACLNTLGVPSLVLDREDCIASLWRKRSYDRLTLHLAKDFCSLPHAPHPPTTPTFMSKHHFIDYLDNYATTFNVRTHLRRKVESAEFDEGVAKWRVAVTNLATGEAEEYTARFLVVASGENDGIVVPDIPGLESFGGEVSHSSQYRSGEKYKGKAVLVVGCGNSGMEIAYDLANYGARASIVVRSPLHVLTKETLWLGTLLMKYLPFRLVDAFVLFLSYLKFGNTSKYGLQRPKEGPFYFFSKTSTYPILDVGTFKKIKSGEIQVLPSLSSIKKDMVTFVDGRLYQFDAIILATGYKSMVKDWLKSDDYLIDDDGMANQKFPNHWKGRNGLYCAGLTRRGIYGSGQDALKIADDISLYYKAGSSMAAWSCNSVGRPPATQFYIRRPPASNQPPLLHPPRAGVVDFARGWGWLGSRVVPRA